MIDSIREHDAVTPITLAIGCWDDCPPYLVTPWVFDQLDLLSLHVYPRSEEVHDAVSVTEQWDVGKPVLVTETFPIRVAPSAWEWYLREIATEVNGLISQFSGYPLTELAEIPTWTPWQQAADILMELGDDLERELPLAQPLLHFEDPKRGTHYYTTDAEDATVESDWLLHRDHAGFVMPFDVGDAVALCAFEHPTVGDFEYVRGCDPPEGYEFRAAVGWVYPSPRPGTVALHEYWNESSRRHRYSTTRDDAALATDGFAYRGIEAHVLSSTTVP